MPKRRVLLLVVEDDDVDQEFLRRVFRSDERVDLVFVETGEAALELLRDDTDQALPHRKIMFVDINLPLMSGLELVAEVRKDPALRSTIIYMLSSSTAPSDLEKAYRNSVAGFIKKSDVNSNGQILLDLIEIYRGTNVFLG